LHRGPDPGPTAAVLSAIRGTALHGYAAETYVANLIGRAIRTLKPTLARAGDSSVSGRDAARMVRTWQIAQARQMADGLRIWLVSLATEADVRAARDLIHPDLLTEEAKAHGR
jgi:hypothetical protein